MIVVRSAENLGGSCELKLLYCLCEEAATDVVATDDTGGFGADLCGRSSERGNSDMASSDDNKGGELVVTCCRLKRDEGASCIVKWLKAVRFSLFRRDSLGEAIEPVETREDLLVICRLIRTGATSSSP